MSQLKSKNFILFLLSVSADFCKLYCNVVGTGAYYLLKQKVIDGTPCAPDSYDVCVNGKCMVCIELRDINFISFFL